MSKPPPKALTSEASNPLPTAITLHFDKTEFIEKTLEADGSLDFNFIQECMDIDVIRIRYM